MAVPGCHLDWGLGVLGDPDLDEIPACVSLHLNVSHLGPFSFFFSTLFIFLYAPKLTVEAEAGRLH